MTDPTPSSIEATAQHPPRPGGRTDAWRARRWRGWLAAFGLILLSPVAGEFLSGYLGQRIWDLPDLALGLGILAPLYGGIAVLIREITRRTGRGWPTILLLATAFGLVQAGLIDQGLIDQRFFAGGPYYAELATYVPWVGIDVSQLLTFVGGHVLCTFAAPIAIVEACVPERADEPWLRLPGSLLMVALYLAGASVILSDTLAKRGADAGALVVVAVVVLGLIVAAFLVPRRRAEPVAKSAPRPIVVGVVAFALLAAHVATREPEPGRWAWPSVAVAVAALALLGWVLLVWSRRRTWSRQHVVAVAGAPLLIYAALAFVVPSLTPGDLLGKYLSNAFFLIVVALVIWWARRQQRAVSPAASDGEHAAGVAAPERTVPTSPDRHNHVE